MQNYTTRDFYAAGYLITQRHRLISHSRANGITTFVFEEDENMQSDINKYYDLTASEE